MVSEREIKEKIRGGAIRVMIVFELLGTPKEHVEQTLKNYIANIKADSRIDFINEDFAEVAELEDGMFSTFVEAEILVSDLSVLTWLAVNFSPASIEIMEPNKLTFKESELTAWYNDLLSKLHEISTVLRSERGVNQQLVVSMNSLIKNSILLSLKDSEKKIEEITTDVGITQEQLEPFMKYLIDKKKIKKNADKYSL